MQINYLDLFSGINGFALGIQQAGIKFKKHYFSEIDKYAIQITKRHFPNAIELGDINNIKPETLGKIDLVTFGFPCQDLSIAGKRAGLGGTRSGLFFKAMWLVKELLPFVFIFENVKGLLTSNEGKDFEIVLREIADIGLYECEWQLVNTSWVLPQNRERIYFIGHLGEKSGQKVFPIGEGNKKSVGELGGGIPTLQARDYKGIGNQPQGLIEVSEGGGQRQSDGKTSMGFSNSTMIHGGVLRKGEYGDGIKEEKSFTMDRTCGRDLLVCQKSKECN